MLIKEMLEALREPIPKQLISSKSLKGNRIEYVAWYDICELLDARCGMGCWEWKVDSLTIDGGYCFMVGRLMIYGEDRYISMSATGLEELNCSSYGDPSSNAEAMAIRRAASKLGLGRDMWRKGPPPNKSAYQSKPSGQSKSKNPPKPTNTRQAAQKLASNFNGQVIQEKPDWWDAGIAYFVKAGLPKGVVETIAAKHKSKQDFFDAATQICKDTIGG